MGLVHMSLISMSLELESFLATLWHTFNFVQHDKTDLSTLGISSLKVHS